MILARVQIPKSVRPPAEVRRRARKPSIDTLSAMVPLGASCWISCCHAWPHVDDYAGWDGSVFLTLSVVSRHRVADWRSPEPAAVPPGMLFVVDPRTRHWLEPEESWNQERRLPWIGLQWEVSRRSAKHVARRIVAELNGAWQIEDPRYHLWQPQAEVEAA